MQISANMIKIKLNREDIIFERITHSNRKIISVRNLIEREAVSCADYVYVTSMKQFLRHIRANIHLPENLICVDTEEKGDSFLTKIRKLSEDVNLIVLRNTYTVEVWSNKIQEIIDRYNQVDQKLMLSLVRNEPMDDILDVCAEFFDNPICAFDESLRLLGQSSNLQSEDYPNMFWKEAYEERYVSANLLDYLKRKGLLAKINQAESALLVELDEGFPTYLTCNLYYDSYKIGTVSVLEKENQVRQEQCEVLDHVVSLIHLAVLREKKKFTVQYSKAQQMMIDLIEGKYIHERRLDQQFQKVGWNTSRGLYLLVIKMSKDDLEGGVSSYISSMVERIVGVNLNVQYQDGMVIIGNRLKSQEEEAKLFQVLEKGMKKQNLKCGKSMGFHKWTEVGQQYRSALAALRLGLKMEPNRNIYEYEAYAAMHVISLCARHIDVQSLCLPDILHLHEVDQESGSELVKSLFTYLMEGKSISKAAAIMNIHKSTLGYRLYKIEDMVKLDLERAEVRNHVIFSCQIVRYLSIMEN